MKYHSSLYFSFLRTRRWLCVAMLSFFVFPVSTAMAQNDEPEKEPEKRELSKDEQAKEDQKNEKPKPPEVIPFFKAELAEIKGYKPGDLITWGNVEPIFAKLREAGVNLPTDKELSQKFLADNDRLVKLIRTKKGAIFFAPLTKTPGAINRMDRYRELPKGYATIEQLMSDPRVKGYKYFIYLADNKQGKKTDLILERNPGGKDFDKPTGRLYYDKQLFAYLDDLLKPTEAAKPDKS